MSVIQPRFFLVDAVLVEVETLGGFRHVLTALLLTPCLFVVRPGALLLYRIDPSVLAGKISRDASHLKIYY